MKTLREQSQEAVERMMSVDDMISRDWVLKRMQFAPDADVVRMAPKVEAEPVWISVKDRLPEYYKDVLVIFRNNGALFTIIAYLTIGGIWVHKGFGRVIGVVTNWMPLPYATKEDNHE